MNNLPLHVSPVYCIRVLGSQRFFILKLDYLNRESSGHALFVLIFKVEKLENRSFKKNNNNQETKIQN